MARRIVDGKYEIVSKLGSGAMGQVLKGRDLRLERPVAVKFLNPGIAENKKARDRFLDEGKKLAKLGHQDNLATIYDCGMENDQPYMVLEFIDGTPLEDLLAKRGPLKAETAVPIFVEILEGIEHAHRRGVVHRDIKPSNILLTRDGHPKVIDFGIAFDPDSQRMTSAGDILCTPAYASPEQAAGKTAEIDHRSDVYSLGAVLFEMLTGKPPLEGESSNATLINHATKDAPPLNDSFGPALKATLSKALAREKAERFQAINQFKAALVNAVPADSWESDSLKAFLSSSPVRETVIEVPSGSHARDLPELRKSRGISWMVYASVVALAAVVVIALWIMKAVRERSEPIPPPAIHVRTPPPPKDWAIVALPLKVPAATQPIAEKPVKTARPAQPPVISAAERTALEAQRADLQTQLKKTLADLKTLKALREDPSRQSELTKASDDLQEQLRSIDKKLAAR
jgi:serine/threonine-protein kinase